MPLIRSQHPKRAKRNQRRQRAKIDYDPRKLGAKCAGCPLRDRQAVPTQIPKRSKLTIVGEAPGAYEEIAGRYFVGPSGEKLDAACVAFGIDRDRDLHLNNALQCRPGRPMEPDEWRLAVECCLPRLVNEINDADTPWALALGRKSLIATLGISDHMKNWLGSVNDAREELSGLRTVTTVHPAFALRGNAAYFPVFYSHLQRAWGYAALGKKPKRWPAIHWKCNDTTLDALERLSKRDRVHMDIEAAGIELDAPLTAIGIGRTDLAVSIPWEPELFYNPRQARRARRLIKRILESPRIAKSAHNGIYDFTVLSDNDFKIKNYATDTLIKKHVYAPGIPSGLQVTYLLEYGAEPWKTIYHVLGDEKGSERFKRALQTDEGRKDLCIYNSKDCVAGDRIDLAGDRRLKSIHNGRAIFDGYMRRSMISLKMRDYGACINLPVLKKHDKALLGRRNHARSQIREIAKRCGALAEIRRQAKAANKEIPDYFNPNSLAHLRILFFQRLKCRPKRYNEKSGNPSLDAKVLRSFLVDGLPRVSNVAAALVRYRRWHKLRSTYVTNLIYECASGGVDAKGEPLAIAHADPKVWGAKTGRWAYGSKGNSFCPNTMPHPKFRKGSRGKKILVSPGLRDIIKPRPGNWIVCADYSQLEARIIAWVADDRAMMDLFDRGEDLHDWTATKLFGLEFSKGQRKQAKVARYAWQYLSDPKNAWLSMVIESPGLQLRDIEKLWEKLDTLHPKIVAYTRDLIARARVQLEEFGSWWVQTAISERRFEFIGEVEPSKIANLPIQGTGADLIDAAIEGLDLDIKWGAKGYEFLLFQVHDEIVAEGPDPVRLCKLFDKHMTQKATIDGRSCVFPIDYKISNKSWGECFEYKTIAEVANVTRGKRGSV